MGNTGTILAIITMNKEIVGGGAPIFFAENEEDQHRLVLYLSRIMKAMVHDLENGVYVLVRH